MRSSRLSKYREKYKGLKFTTKILAICYVLLISITLITASTLAYFSNGTDMNISISSADYWWDKSDLEFIGSNQNIKACAPIEISVELKNNGFSMTGETEYEVYFVANGNPENGDLVAEGTVGIINADETVELTYDAENDGVYKFKAYQREGYGDNYDDREVIWSERVHVNCNAAGPRTQNETEDSDLDDQKDVTSDNDEDKESAASEGDSEKEADKKKDNDKDKSKDDSDKTDKAVDEEKEKDNEKEKEKAKDKEKENLDNSDVDDTDEAQDGDN
ncbi:amyloid fiber anchoring/assembly protein TapA [Evansella tamaricis]|uniref:Amyloid fiber anchoring/assembly protein TapA n=1 Tax=Evansella tamaricis TaxID=2069301 RepID=A0ABS6JEL4_9BACI|nr:amyloid fiber anchoring/assembly protein TapA [Evansella tamaricis]MBU9712107.1 amyloid fiber anchoring/assembly protein TapA [Evansella tamaricis]